VTVGQIRRKEGPSRPVEIDVKRSLLWAAWLCAACSAPSPVNLYAESHDTPAPEKGAPTASAAPPQPSNLTPRHAFRIPNDRRLIGIAGSGDTVFFSLEGSGFRDTRGHVGRLARSGDIISHHGPAARHIRVIRDEAIAVGEGGGVAVFKNGAWEYRLAPALEAEALGSATLGDNGELFAAGEKHALYELSADGATWRTWRYGTPVNGVRAALVVSGAIRLVLGSGEVLEFSGGAFKRVPIQGLTVGSLASETQASWIDERAKTVWLAGEKSLTVIDVSAKRATVHESPLFFDLKAISGVATPKGSLVVVSTFGESAYFDGTDFFELDKDGADVVFVDGRHAQAYLLSHGRSKIVDVKHPWLGTGKGTLKTR